MGELGEEKQLFEVGDWFLNADYMLWLRNRLLLNHFLTVSSAHVRHCLTVGQVLRHTVG